MHDTLRFLAAAAMAGAALSSCASPDRTADNYRFEAIDTQVRQGRDAEMRVRLVQLPGERPVTGATIYEHRFEMWMSGYKVAGSVMVDGANASSILASEEGNGIYRVHAQIPMSGQWQATLTARIPGETLPVRGTVSVRAR